MHDSGDLASDHILRDLFSILIILCFPGTRVPAVLIGPVHKIFFGRISPFGFIDKNDPMRYSPVVDRRYRFMNKTETILEDLRQMIQNQSFAGGRIPGERELAEKYSCCRGTIRAVLAHLADDGWIERRRNGRNGR